MPVTPATTANQKPALDPRTYPADEVALVWHDLTCPEADQCRSRALHAAGHPLITSGLLHKFAERLRPDEQ